jgi:uncharacterized protein (DUF433 family)
MEDLLKRITSKPGICGGKPTIRGMRIRVSDILELLANGISVQEILEEELPDLEEDDIKAALLYAAQKMDDIKIINANES